MRRFSTVALILILGAHLSATRAVAQEGDDDGRQWSIRAETDGPNLRDLRLAPGETLTGAIVALNYLTEPLTLDLRVVDGLVASRGGLALGEESGTLTDWIDLAVERVTLAPRGVETIPFTITIPPGAADFEHVGGFVGQLPPEAVPEPEGEGLLIKIIERVGVPLIVTVGDPTTCALVLESGESAVGGAGDWIAILRFRITGDRHFRGTANLSLAHMGTGEPSHTWAGEVGYSGAGLMLAYPVGIDGVPSQPGRYQLTGSLTSSEVADCAVEVDYRTTISGDDIKDSEDRKAELAAAAAGLILGSLTRTQSVGVLALVLVLPITAIIGAVILWAIRPDLIGKIRR